MLSLSCFCVCFQCWGHNNNGQLGQGDTLDRGDTPSSLGTNLAAIAFGAGDVPTAIECGLAFTCVMFDDSSIKACFFTVFGGQRWLALP